MIKKIQIIYLKASHFIPGIKGRTYFLRRTLIPGINYFWRLHWQLFVLGAVSDYWVEHLSLACAICWASRRHKPPILAQLVILILNEIVFYCKYRAKF